MPTRPSTTAEVVALVRAREALEPLARRIVDDPFAARFLAATGSPLAAFAGGGALSGALGRIADLYAKAPGVGLAALVLARHRVMDDLVREETRAGATQLVILGAGYDARAYRLLPPEGPAAVFEVDHPTLSARKRDLVARVVGEIPPHVRFVSVDFERERLFERLRASGFDPAARTVFVWEGVTYYLEAAAVRGTLEAVRAHAARGSTIVFDAWAGVEGPLRPLVALARLIPAAGTRLLGEPFRFALESPREARALLERHGFEPLFVKDAAALRDLLRALGRPLLHVPPYAVVAAGRIPLA